jgi:hypothetical protein
MPSSRCCCRRGIIWHEQGTQKPKSEHTGRAMWGRGTRIEQGASGARGAVVIKRSWPAEDGPALAGLGPALAGLHFFEDGFSGSDRLFPLCRPALAGSGCCAKSLSNWAEIWRENRRFWGKYKELGLENLWQCRSTPKTSNLWIKTAKNSTNQEIKIRGNFGAIFLDIWNLWSKSQTRVNPWQPKAADTIWWGVTP